MTNEILLLLIVNSACAFGLTLLLYRNFLKDKTQRILAVFRFLSFFSLGLLLINPEIDRTTYTVEKPKLIFAFDDSESIDQLSNPKEINTFISELRADEDLNANYSIDVLGFGDHVFNLKDSLRFEAKTTNISKALNYFNTVEDSEATAVLVTDGNQTLGQDFSFKTLNDNLIPYSVVVGDTTSYKDTKIDLVNVNNYAYFNNQFPIEVFVSQNITSTTQQRLKVLEKDRLIASKLIEIPAEGSSRTNFNIPAKPVGTKILKIELEPLSEEKNIRNNHKTVSIDVIDSRSKILLVSDLIHPDIGFFNRILDSNKELEFKNTSTTDAFKISDYDLVIFYQPQSTSSSILQEAINKKINYLIIGGMHTDYDMLNRFPLGFQKEAVSSSEDYFPQLNLDFSLFQINSLDFKSFPPLKDQFGSVKLTKASSVLLQKTINGFETGSPQWIFDVDDDVKRSILFGENLWRWRAAHFVDQSSFTDFDRSFQKIIQFLAQSKTKNTLDVDLDPVINSGDDKMLTLTYYNSNFESDNRFNFDLSLTNEDRNTTKTTRLVKQKNKYVYNLSGLEPGNYSYSISSDDISLSKKGKFQVLNYSNEMQFETSNFEGLQKLFGKENLYLLSQKEELISKLKSNAPKSIQKSIKKTQSLIDIEWLIVLLSLTLGIEWFYRKYKGLI